MAVGLASALLTSSAIAARMPVSTTGAPPLHAALAHLAAAIKQKSIRLGRFPSKDANTVLLGVPRYVVGDSSNRDYFYPVTVSDGQTLTYEVHLTCGGTRVCGHFTVAINVVPPTLMPFAKLQGIFAQRFYPSPDFGELMHRDRTGTGAGDYALVVGRGRGSVKITVTLDANANASNIVLEG